MAAVCFVISPCLENVSVAADNNVMTKTGKVNPRALREMLVKGLKATREDEKLYINFVVRMVALEVLPSRMCTRRSTTHEAASRLSFPVFSPQPQDVGKRKKLDL